MPIRPHLNRLRAAGGVALAIAAAGCATLPSSGPTGREIEQAARGDHGQAPLFDIVDLDPAAVARASASTPAGGTPRLASLQAAGQNDLIGVGDVLAVSIYEVGVGLFGGNRMTTEGFDPSAHAEQFAAVPVERDGTVKLPYVGTIPAAGHTTAEVGGAIERAYHGQSQRPQVLVAVRENNSEVAYLMGEVRKPGRFPLTLRNERLLDAIAASGGSAAPPPETVVRVTRGDRTVDERLDAIDPGSADDLMLVAGDRIDLLARPRSFVVLGSSPKVAQVAFEQDSVSLAEAVARAGGPSDANADPAQIFLFRQDAPPGPDGRPVIYRLDLMKPESYFLAQRFPMRDKDVLYVSNARANRPSKLVGIINQLFSPFISIRAVTH